MICIGKTGLNSGELNAPAISSSEETILNLIDRHFFNNELCC